MDGVGERERMTLRFRKYLTKPKESHGSRMVLWRSRTVSMASLYSWLDIRKVLVGCFCCCDDDEREEVVLCGGGGCSDEMVR